MRTLVVSGIGNFSKSPDTVEIVINVLSENKNYEKAVSSESEKTARLTADLASIGMQAEELKTASFIVDRVNDNIRDADGTYKSVFKAYCCRHRMNLEFPFTKERLSQVVGCLSKCDTDAEFSIRFKLKENGELMQSLLESAVKDAVKKAAALAAASGVKLAGIQNVSYGESMPSPYSAAEFRPAMLKNCRVAAMADNVTPTDVVMSTTVSITWEIM